MSATDHRNGMTARERFFHEHAGWSYNPATETSAEGRARCARELAQAEADGMARGWHVHVKDDPYGPMEDDAVGSRTGRPPPRWRRVRHCSDPYLTVVAAELADEALHEVPA